MINCALLLFFIMLNVTQAVSAESMDSIGTSPLNHSSIDTAFFTNKLSITLAPRGTYAAARANISSQRNRIRNDFANRVRSDSLYRIAKTTIENCIVNELLPFWYGTRWNFNGTTQIPGSGVIGGGFFVSMMLHHCGFTINRFTFAQQNPVLEAASLQLNDSIIVYQCNAATFLRQFTKEFQDGLYFAGLDHHAGFLLVRSGEMLFIHSSYLKPQCVVIEKAIGSEAFNASTNYNIAELSANRRLIDRWLDETEIVIRTK